MAQLATRLQNLESLEQRVAGILRDEAALADEVRDIARAHAIPFDERVPDAAAQEIVERFRRGENAREERARLNVLIADREAELADERARLAEATRELTGLCSAAGAGDAEELQWIEGRVGRRASSSALAAIGRPSSTARWAAYRDVVPGAAKMRRRLPRASMTRAELADLDERRESARSTLAGLLAGQQQQSAGSAAEAAQEEQAISAALRERVGRYARLRVASSLLDRAVERYRRENQAPILKRASELFPRLTEERYRGLRVGREESAIVALRSDGRECAPADRARARSISCTWLSGGQLERFVESASRCRIWTMPYPFRHNRKRPHFVVEAVPRLQIGF